MKRKLYALIVKNLENGSEFFEGIFETREKAEKYIIEHFDGEKEECSIIETLLK